MMHRRSSNNLFFRVSPAAIPTQASALRSRYFFNGYDRTQCRISPAVSSEGAPELLTATWKRMLQSERPCGRLLLVPVSPIVGSQVHPTCGERSPASHRGRSLLTGQGRLQSSVGVSRSSPAVSSSSCCAQLNVAAQFVAHSLLQHRGMTDRSFCPMRTPFRSARGQNLPRLSLSKQTIPLLRHRR